MPTVVPSQVIATIDQLFPHAATAAKHAALLASQSGQLRGVVELTKAVPYELLIVPPEQYADLILSISTIENQVAVWTSRGGAGGMTHVREYDAITVIRRVLSQCRDEFPAPSTVELAFVTPPDVRESIRRDVGAANRAFANAEWKAATVLGGATIEALLHWRLNQPSPTPAQISATVSALASAGSFSAPQNLDNWVLYQFIEVSRHLSLIKPNTATAADLARDFRNLIHPGAAVRRGQMCDRATALSALAALEHVIRDLTPA